MGYIQDLGATQRAGYTGRTSAEHESARTRRATTTTTTRAPVEGKRRRDYRAGVDPAKRSQVYRDGQWVDEGMALQATRVSMSDADKLQAARWNCEQARVPAEYLDACATELVKRQKAGKDPTDALQKVVADLQKAVEKGEIPAATPAQPLPAGTPIPASSAGLFGIPLTYLLIGGAAIVGGVIIIRRRKKS